MSHRHCHGACLASHLHIQPSMSTSQSTSLWIFQNLQFLFKNVNSWYVVKCLYKLWTQKKRRRHNSQCTCQAHNLCSDLVWMTQNVKNSNKTAWKCNSYVQLAEHYRQHHHIPLELGCLQHQVNSSIRHIHVCMAQQLCLSQTEKNFIFRNQVFIKGKRLWKCDKNSLTPLIMNMP